MKVEDNPLKDAEPEGASPVTFSTDTDDQVATPAGSGGVDDGRYPWLRRFLTVIAARANVCMQMTALLLLTLAYCVVVKMAASTVMMLV